MTGIQVSIPDDVIGEVIDGEAVLLNLTTGVYFGLNASGTVAWQLFRDTGNGARAVDELVRRWGVDRETAQNDIDILIGALVAKGLLRRREE